MLFSLWQVAGMVALLALHIDASFYRVVAVIALSGSMFLFNKFLHTDKVDKPSRSAHAVLAGQLPPPSTVEELQTSLETAGITTSFLGKGVAKSLSSLLSELIAGECSLNCGCITGRITRSVEVVFVVLHFKGKVLVETSQVLPDGRLRERRMVLAEKRKTSDRSPIEAALRGLYKELNIGNGAEAGLPSCLSYCKAQDACFLEEMDSASYPGLPCVYQNHQLHFDIHPNGLSQAQQLLSMCHLPECEPFETQEPEGDGILRHCWAWVDAAEAQQGRVKGLHFLR